MRAVRLLGVIGAACAALSSGCKDLDPPPPPPFQFYVKVDSDPGHPVAGAIVSQNKKQIGNTGPDGRAMLTIHGAEGAIVDVSIRCPDGLQSPTKPLSIRLTRIADKSKAPEYGVACPPMLRRVVVAVKADNGPNLQVMYLSRPVTRTDASGAAHFALEVAPGAQFTVGLDTTDNPRLKPQNPTKPFTVGQTDDILVFEQKFDVEKIKVHYKPIVIPKALN
jgi:hypothetical protein